MYRRILIPMENSAADQTILEHIKPFARLTGAHLLLVHVADGFVARNYNQLQLAESEEMRVDRAYLDKRQRELREEGFVCETVLALGQPSSEIVKLAQARDIDLIAMASHGHRLLGDILHGSTITEVRHRSAVPLLVVPAGK
ncbi:MAG: universal stress protein [Chthoniobacterales bacterium]|nr:MAG: universal stress protein [Chthoniobacterales bacterium]